MPKPPDQPLACEIAVALPSEVTTWTDDEWQDGKSDPSRTLRRHPAASRGVGVSFAWGPMLFPDLCSRCLGCGGEINLRQEPGFSG